VIVTYSYVIVAPSISGTEGDRLVDALQISVLVAAFSVVLIGTLYIVWSRKKKEPADQPSVQ
jgi:hypothetical protein